MRLSKLLFLTYIVTSVYLGSAFAAQNYAQQLQRISTEEGLSQSFVTKSLQDDLGYIWIGTVQGLNRFDGYQVTKFNGGVGLDQYNIATMFKTHDGKIVASTELSGAYLIDPLRLTATQIYSGYSPQKTDETFPILAIEQIQDIFYFAIHNQIYSLHANDKKLNLVATIPGEMNFIRTLRAYKENLYIGANQGLYSIDLSNTQLVKVNLHQDIANTADNNNVKFLTIDSQLGLLVGTVEGMYAIAFDSNNFIDNSKLSTVIPDFNIWDYQKTPYGEFIATEQGLFQYYRETNSTEFVLNFSDSQFNITENTINDLMIDDTGMFWLASRTQGIFTWAIQTRRFNKIKLLNNNVINAVNQDKNGSFWFGTDNGITHLSNDKKQMTTYLQSNDRKAVYRKFAVYDIIPAHLTLDDRYLWLVRFYDIFLFDKTTGKIVPKKKTYEEGAPTDYYGFAEIKNDTFAYFSNENFYIYNGKNGVRRIVKGLKEQLDPSTAYAFHRPLSTHPNDLLLSTYTHLYRYNEKSETLTTVYAAKNIRGNNSHTVENWALDDNNILWLATTHEGLVGLDAKSYKRKYHFGMTAGLKTQSIYALLLDQFGFLWISSQNGLYQLNTHTLDLTAYSIKDGLSVNQFSAIGASKLNNGSIIFGSSNGALSFHPAEFADVLKTNSSQPTQITNITLLSKRINYHPFQYLSVPLQLNHDDIGLEISFSNFDFQNIDKTRYKVSLSGPTSLEYDNLKSNKVFFTKLPPGNYTLGVSSDNLNHSEKEKPTIIRFNVAYPAWQSPLAYIVYTLVFITVLFLLFWQYRVRKIAIENAHRKTIHSQKQTELALSNNKSGIWDYTFEDNTVNTQRGIELGYSNLPERIDIQLYMGLIHPDDRRRVESQWLSFIKKNKQQHWQATYRLRHRNGYWLWYQDLGQIMYKEHSNTPLYVSGIYTNITEQRANEQQAKILGEAFSQINDWLLILDDQLMPFSANNSFLETFSSMNSTTQLSPKLFIKAVGKAKCKELAAKLKALKPKQNWRTDTYIHTAKNEKHPIHLSVTVVAKENNDVGYYVVVISDLTEQKQAENELRYLANYDPLTSLPNRSLMYQNIENTIKRAKMNNSQSALLFIDLDKFKPVNDSFGHAVGDKLLCNITSRVSNMLDDTATLGRQSGDEFLVLIENITSIQSLSKIVKDISQELANKAVIEDFSINISASIGVALYPFDATTTDTLIRNADVAMMHAKQAGRNGFKFFSEKMNEQIKQKLILENDLKDAANDHKFFNHYQPIVDIQARVINGVELLMRWENKGQLISPAQFIPIAEETGLIETLTEQALNRAIIELASVLSSNPLFYISLNLSPKHILKENIASRLLSVLEQHSISPIQIRLEITENTLLEDKLKASKQLQKLQAAGFKLLLDDFGTGYSSLTYLSQFPINVIKIDQSFVNSIGIDKSDESIMRTIYTLADNLNLNCIAEGVETKAQMLFLADMGCHVLQGYYFAKPMNAKELCKPDSFKNIIDLF